MKSNHKNTVNTIEKEKQNHKTVAEPKKKKPWVGVTRVRKKSATCVKTKVKTLAHPCLPTSPTHGKWEHTPPNEVLQSQSNTLLEQKDQFDTTPDAPNEKKNND